MTAESGGDGVIIARYGRANDPCVESARFRRVPAPVTPFRVALAALRLERWVVRGVIYG